MTIVVFLNESEIAELDRQLPQTKSNGGWQSLIVTIAQAVDRRTGRLVLSGLLLDRIARYAFKYRNGGWQSRLRRIFGRTLGPTLDSASQKAA